MTLGSGEAPRYTDHKTSILLPGRDAGRTGSRMKAEPKRTPLQGPPQRVRLVSQGGGLLLYSKSLGVGTVSRPASLFTTISTTGLTQRLFSLVMTQSR